MEGGVQVAPVSPFQGLDHVAAVFSQGVALGFILSAFQAPILQPAAAAAASQR